MEMRKLWGVRAGVVVALAVGSTASCSSGTGGGSSGAYTSEATYCSQRDARTKSCAPETGAPAFDAGTVDAGGTSVVSSSCAKDYRCKVAILAAPDVYFNCRGNTDCSATAGDSTCTAKAGEGRSTAQAEACLKKYNECKAGGVKTFDDDNCTILPALNSATAQKLMNCVELACDLAATCFKDLENQIPECD